MQMCYDGSGLGDGYGDPSAYYGYGLGGIFDVIAAPFKAIGKGAAAVGKGAVKVAKFGAPIAVGFAAGGPAGAAAAGAAKLRGLLGGRRAATSPYSSQSQPYTQSTFVATRPGSGPYFPSQQQYPNTAPVGGGDLKSEVINVLNELKNMALGTAAQRIVETPAGQQAVREKVSGDISRYMMPAMLGLGGLALVMAMTRR